MSRIDAFRIITFMTNVEVLGRPSKNLVRESISESHSCFTVFFVVAEDAAPVFSEYGLPFPASISAEIDLAKKTPEHDKPMPFSNWQRDEQFIANQFCFHTALIPHYADFYKEGGRRS